MKLKPNYLFVDKRVHFLDTKHGFWRIGVCYKEDKKYFYCYDVLKHRYKVSKKEPENIEELVDSDNGKPK